MSEITVENITPETYTDDFVVDCARVSYAKRADQFTPEQNEKLIRYLFNPPDSVPHWAPFAGPRLGYTVLLTREELCNFILRSNMRGFVIIKIPGSTPGYQALEINGSLWAWKENIWNLPMHVSETVRCYLNSQFPICTKVFGWPTANDSKSRPVGYGTHVKVTNLRIKAPIFVARQLAKHQVDLVWSESSRRYLKDAPELWWPKEWHKAPTHSKQGASDELFDNSNFDQNNLIGAANKAVFVYNKAIAHGMAPEEARMILPQNMMTEWIWTGTHDAFRRVLRERLAPGAQKSGTRETAEKIKQALNW